MNKLFVAVLLMLSGNAYAAKYGMAGCGLGSLIIGDKPGKVQIFSSILNGFGSQTSAITTGSSNCSGSGEYADLKYIEDNQESLKVEIAQGNGETLDGLIEMWGCADSAKASLKQNYSVIFNSDNKAIVQISNSMKTTLKNNSCQKI